MNFLKLSDFLRKGFFNGFYLSNLHPSIVATHLAELSAVGFMFGIGSTHCLPAHPKHPSFPVSLFFNKMQSLPVSLALQPAINATNASKIKIKIAAFMIIHLT